MWNKRLYRVQLRRAFGGWLFKISFLVSLLLVVLQICTNYRPIYKAGSAYPATVFSQWMGNDGYTYASLLFYDLLPLLAVLPFGTQYLLDRHSGYLKNLMTRIPARPVIVSYGVCTFLTAFAASFVPHMLSLLFSSLLYPALLPQAATLAYSVSGSSLFSALFYTHPYQYCVLYSAITALYHAMLALVGMGLSFFIKNVFLSLVCPFLINFFVSYLAMMVGFGFLAPLYVFQPMQLVHGQPAVIVGWYLSCLMAAGILFGRHMKAYELY